MLSEQDFDENCLEIKEIIDNVDSDCKALFNTVQRILKGESDLEFLAPVMDKIVYNATVEITECVIRLSDMEMTHGMCNDDLEKELRDILVSVEETAEMIEGVS